MRDYQPHKNNPYWLPRTLYRRTLALIRDYDRMVEVRDSIPTDKPDKGGGSGPGDPTGSKGLKSARASEDIDVVDRALREIPEEFRPGVWAAAAYGARYPADADRSTYSRHKSRFIYMVAKYKGWIL